MLNDLSDITDVIDTTSYRFLNAIQRFKPHVSIFIMNKVMVKKSKAIKFQYFIYIGFHD